MSSTIDDVAIDYALEHGMPVDAVRAAQLTLFLDEAQLGALGEGEARAQAKTHFLLMRGQLLDDLTKALGARPKTTMGGDFVHRFGDRFVVWPVVTYENVVEAWLPMRGLWLTVNRLPPRAPYPHEVAVLSERWPTT